ncbi:MAG: YqaJ viral recombinase family protein [Sideroxydans sp.]|nr:YqaJ viral recombinase family protein [Sideroxydans sp.]
MNRQTHNLQQGSQSWHDFRAKHYGASELPAAAGASKYTTRADLVKEKATGISKEIDTRTQALFDKGHAAEESARGIAEEIIGEELSPMVMSLEIDDIPLSASLDGCTFGNEIIFEHKLYSEKLAEQVRNKALEPHYCLQMDQQLLVSGASKCLFMTSDGTKENMAWMWYDGAQADYEAIVNTWKQFATDVAAYVPQEVKEVAKAEAIKALPAVFVQATGMVTASNLSEFKEAATTFIANINTELVTDQDFADAESTVKFCKEAELNLEATKASVLAQMSTVDEVTRTLDHIAAQLRDKRLMLDKLVKSEKDSRRLAIVMSGGTRYADHLTELKIPVAYMPLMPRVDFGAAVKGLKSLSSMQDKVDALLANTKIEADAIARDINAKLAWCKESSAGFGFLFSDLSALIANNGMEAFQAIVTARIEKHKADEAAKEEATRIRIQQEEEAKAQAKAKAEQEAIIAKAVEAERAKAQEELTKAQQEQVVAGTSFVSVSSEGVKHIPAAEVRLTPDDLEERRKAAQLAESATAKTAPALVKPADGRIIEAVMHRFNCSHGTACNWIMECAENMKVTA